MASQAHLCGALALVDVGLGEEWRDRLDPRGSGGSLGGLGARGDALAFDVMPDLGLGHQNVAGMADHGGDEERHQHRAYDLVPLEGIHGCPRSRRET